MKPILPIFAVFCASFCAASAFGASCESLSSLALPDTTITASSVGAGEFTQAAAAGGKKGKGGNPFAATPAFCRVQLTIKPTSDSDIQMEIWLPTSGWNKKYEANGNGGWSGAVTPATLAAGVERGYATAMTDTGHEGGSASFAMGHPEKLIDWAYRSTHEMAVKGKAVVKAFYGEDPKFSYYTGCSAGGRRRAEGSADVPERFRRDRRRITGLELDRTLLASRLDRAGHA